MLIFIFILSIAQQSLTGDPPKTPEGWKICPIIAKFKLNKHVVVSSEGKISTWKSWKESSPILTDYKPTFLREMKIDITGVEAMFSDQDNMTIITQKQEGPDHSVLVIPVDSFDISSPEVNKVLKLSRSLFWSQFGPSFREKIHLMTRFHSGMSGRSSIAVKEFVVDFPKGTKRIAIKDKNVIINQDFNPMVLPIYRSGDDYLNGQVKYSVIYKKSNESKDGYIFRTEFRMEDSFIKVKSNDEFKDNFRLTNRFVGCPDSFCFGADFHGITKHHKKILIFNGPHVFLLPEFGSDSTFEKPELFTRVFKAEIPKTTPVRRLEGWIDDAMTIRDTKFFKGKEMTIIFLKSQMYFFESTSETEDLKFEHKKTMKVSMYFGKLIEEIDSVAVGKGGPPFTGTKESDTIILTIFDSETYVFKIKGDYEAELVSITTNSNTFPLLPSRVGSVFIDDDGVYYFFSHGFYFKGNKNSLHGTDEAKVIAGNLIQCTDEGYAGMNIEMIGIRDLPSFTKHLMETAYPVYVGRPKFSGNSTGFSISTSKFIAIIVVGIAFVIVITGLFVCIIRALKRMRISEDEESSDDTRSG
jgi:hypothetical protein